MYALKIKSTIAQFSRSLDIKCCKAIGTAWKDNRNIFGSLQCRMWRCEVNKCAINKSINYLVHVR